MKDFSVFFIPPKLALCYDGEQEKKLEKAKTVF